VVDETEDDSVKAKVAALSGKTPPYFLQEFIVTGVEYDCTSYWRVQKDIIHHVANGTCDMLTEDTNGNLMIHTDNRDHLEPIQAGTDEIDEIMYSGPNVRVWFLDEEIGKR